jgi:hypothetical protein
MLILLDENINVIKKNTEALLDASKEVGPEVNTEKIKYWYIFVLCCKTTGQNRYMRVANEFFENVTKFKHMRTIVTNPNCIHEEIKSRMSFFWGGGGCFVTCSFEYFVRKTNKD